MKAKFYSDACPECGFPIEIGEEIESHCGRWRHVKCEAKEIGVNRYDDEENWGPNA